MFHFFERTLKPTAVRETAEPPPGLVAFYWHFARQAKPLFIGLFAVGFAVALIEVMIPVFIGKVVTLVTASKPEELLATAWPWLLGMAGVLLVLRPIASTTQHLLMNQAIAANVSTASAGRTIGTCRGSPGRSFRTTSPDASRPASCRLDRRSAKASCRC